jgi:hypothetical protein
MVTTLLAPPIEGPLKSLTCSICTLSHVQSILIRLFSQFSQDYSHETTPKRLPTKRFSFESSHSTVHSRQSEPTPRRFFRAPTSHGQRLPAQDGPQDGAQVHDRRAHRGPLHARRVPAVSAGPGERGRPGAGPGGSSGVSGTRRKTRARSRALGYIRGHA